MKTHTTESGFGSAAVIGVLAVLILGGGAYFVTSDDEMAEKMDKNRVSQETSGEIEDEEAVGVSHETDTMLKDDPKWKS